MSPALPPGRIAIGDPAAVQTVTLTDPTVVQNPFGPGVVNFAGAPNFAPTRIAVPGPPRLTIRATVTAAPTSNGGPHQGPAVTTRPAAGTAPTAAGGPGPFWSPPGQPAKALSATSKERLPYPCRAGTTGRRYSQPIQI